MLLLAEIGNLDASHGVIAAVTGLTTAALAALFKYLITNKKIDNQFTLASREQLFKHYQELLNDLSERMDRLQAHLTHLEEAHANCQSENERLTRRVQELEQEVVRLKYGQGLQQVGGAGAVIVCDQNLNVIQWGPAATMLLRYFEAEVQGTNFRQLVAEQSVNELNSTIELVKTSSGSNRVATLRIKPKDGPESLATAIVSGWAQPNGQWHFGITLRLM